MRHQTIHLDITMAIFRWRTLWTSAILAVACGQPGGGAAPVPVIALPIDRLYVLEAIGAPADDTTFVLSAGQDRRVLIRHGAPDNTPFAILDFPASSLGHGPVTMVFRPLPGRAGAEIEVTRGSLSDSSATITFAYPQHFLAPAGAVARFGSLLAYERALRIGYLAPGVSDVDLLPSTRPGSDLLRGPIPGPGRFLVAAPR